MRKALVGFAIVASSSLGSTLAGGVAAGAAPVPTTSCQVFPVDNVWNTDISSLPVYPSSPQWLASIPRTGSLGRSAGRRDEPRHPVHRAADRQELPVARASPGRNSVQLLTASDGCAFQTASQLRYLALQSTGPGHPEGDAALRVDPGRQRQ